MSKMNNTISTQAPIMTKVVFTTESLAFKGGEEVRKRL